MSRLSLSVIVLIVSLILLSLLIIDGVAITTSLFRFSSAVVTLMMLLISAFDLFLWRLAPEWLTRRPKIYGTWQGTLQSNWIDPNTEKQIAPIECYVVIRQTFFKFSLRQMTIESPSDLIGKEIVLSPSNVFQVFGVYRNEPSPLIRDRSPIHYGGLRLEVVGTPVSALRGYYWTDRDTKGELDFTERKKKFLHDFQSARNAFGSKFPKHPMASSS